MFKAVLADVGLMKDSVPIIAEIIDEGVFKADGNGLSLLTPDRTMVAVVDFRILSSAFESFQAENSQMGLNLANLVAVLRRVKGTDKLTMEQTENKLKFTVQGKGGTRRFEIPIIEISSEKPPVDQLTFPSRVEISSEVLEDGIADAEVIGDSVVLEAEPEKFKMYAKGDITSAEMEISKDDKSMLSLHAEQNVKARYPLEYLKKMAKAAKLSKQLVLEFGTDYPMRLSFKSIDKMQLSFILAPRVSED